MTPKNIQRIVDFEGADVMPATLHDSQKEWKQSAW
jgi:hypothetical protein